MRREKDYRERCAARGLDAAGVDSSVAAVEALEDWARCRGAEAEEIPLPLVEGHIADLVAGRAADDSTLLALARYFAVLREEPKAIRILAYLLPIGVMPAMAARLAKMEGEALRDRVMRHVEIPPAGAPPEAYPSSAAAFVSALESELGAEKARRVLQWNVHGIPAAAFAQEREHFLASPSIDEWLDGYHEREVAVLERHAASGALWFEQKITPRVVEFVRSNPEIRGGRRVGKRIFTTKIPYDPERWLGSSDPIEKRRLACHCPFAASTIGACAGAGGSAPGPLWCSCSEGYEKFMYDIIFGVETSCEALETAIAGNELCRFAITIP
ncbi:MAG: hypothetical protein Q8M76_06155 [Spirochaetaceae bacterium]|nr:hypothetical protein [Spirochaetaceae bacterium]